MGYSIKGLSPVIPVRLEDTKVPERLSSIHWVDLFEKEGTEKIINALKKMDIPKNIQNSGM